MVSILYREGYQIDQENHTDKIMVVHYSCWCTTGKHIYFIYIIIHPQTTQQTPETSVKVQDYKILQESRLIYYTYIHRVQGISFKVQVPTKV